MHKAVKRFGLDGIVGDDADFIRLRDQFEAMILKDMRADGYVPILGFGPFWSTDYDEKKDSYGFVLSVYGTYIGRRKACLVEGISVDGQELLRPTPPTKSKPSSSNAT